MTKITYPLAAQLVAAVSALRRRTIAQQVCPITPEQLLRLSLPPDDYAVLQQALMLYSPRRYANARCALDVHQYITAPPGVVFPAVHSANVTLIASGSESLPILVPERITPKPSDDDTSGAYASFVEWLQWRFDFSYKFGMLVWLIEKARDTGISLEQLRFLVPGTLMLCKVGAGDLEKYFDRLTNFRAPSTTPKVTPVIREACVFGSEALALSSLLDEHTPVYGAGVFLESITNVTRAGAGPIAIE